MTSASAAPLLSVRGMVKRYPRPGMVGALGGRAPAAVDGASLEVRPGEVVGLIGESGSGKTTLVRAGLGLLSYEAGEVSLLGRPLPRRARRFGPMARGAQLLLQDPDASLNPGLTPRTLLWESARLHRPDEDPERVVTDAAERVGILHRLDGLPHQLSGGEKRRVGIARLLVADPLLVAADEPTAGLDAALKADIVDLLLAGRDPRRGYLIVSHDLPLVSHACHRVVVLYGGRVVEEAPVRLLGRGPHHPYTAALLAAAGLAPPIASTRAVRPAGREAAGCPYHGPCPLGTEACRRTRPTLATAPGGSAAGPAHRVACLHVSP